jgi:GH15 family glucan-1,4-alpha-glucosidase
MTPEQGQHNSPYPPLADYGYIADCHSSALISRSGSIDWCCMPRIDSSSCFGRLLGWKTGGYCRIAPAGRYEISRRYLGNSLILETTYRAADGQVRLLDLFPMRKGGQHRPHAQILRIAEGIKGKIQLLIDIVPRFDYGAVRPWIRRQKGTHHYTAIGGETGLFISSDIKLQMMHRHTLRGSVVLRAGERCRLSISYRKPENLDEGLVSPPSKEELDRRLEETIQWWEGWFYSGKISGPYAPQIARSAVVLKGLSNAPTGAIAAAPTTSLPEAPGGSRNWDYRFSWIRDSYFTVRSLARLGYVKEADGFRRFVERSAAGSADEIQIVFGVGGERRLHEFEINELEGYRGASPVRGGNAAESQKQLDVYGELMDLAWQWHVRGHSPDDDYWVFLKGLVNAAARLWNTPDQGIWEMRGKPRHFVQSKVMCWAALDRGIRLSKELKRIAPIQKWEKVRSEIQKSIEENGYDSKRGVFIQAYGRPNMDAALLLLPTVGFIEYDDDRMVRTTDAIRLELEQDGLLRRYPPADDGMEGREGVFLACSFWLVECLARQNRLKEATAVFKAAISKGNDLGLFSEEYDMDSGEMLGNFPQGLSHLSLISSAVALAEMEGKCLDANR